MLRGSIRASALSALVLLGTGVSAGQSLTRNEADSMDRKLAAIFQTSLTPTATATRRVRTSFTEREVNAYFLYQGKEQLPIGVLNPQFTISDAGRVQAKALVDLDAVRTSKPRTMLDPANLFLHGTVEVRAAGTLVAANGKGTFTLESATLGGVPIAKSLLQMLVTHYSRTPETPDGVDLDKPFALPAAIRAVETQRGTATIIQ
jgi:hypothetical protein